LHDLGSPGELVSLFFCAAMACELGDVERVRELIRDIELVSQTWRKGYVRLPAATYLRARVLGMEGDPVTAAALLEQGLAEVRPGAAQQDLVTGLTRLGHTRCDLGQSRAALAAFGEAAQIARVRRGSSPVAYDRTLIERSRHPGKPGCDQGFATLPRANGTPASTSQLAASDRG
jgi:hypothetical protein